MKKLLMIVLSVFAVSSVAVASHHEKKGHAKQKKAMKKHEGHEGEHKAEHKEEHKAAEHHEGAAPEHKDEGAAH